MGFALVAGTVRIFLSIARIQILHCGCYGCRCLFFYSGFIWDRCSWGSSSVIKSVNLLKSHLVELESSLVMRASRHRGFLSSARRFFEAMACVENSLQLRADLGQRSR